MSHRLKDTNSYCDLCIELTNVQNAFVIFYKCYLIDSYLNWLDEKHSCYQYNITVQK